MTFDEAKGLVDGRYPGIWEEMGPLVGDEWARCVPWAVRGFVEFDGELPGLRFVAGSAFWKFRDHNGDVGCKWSPDEEPSRTLQRQGYLPEFHAWLEFDTEDCGVAVLDLSAISVRKFVKAFYPYVSDDVVPSPGRYVCLPYEGIDPEVMVYEPDGRATECVAARTGLNPIGTEKWRELKAILERSGPTGEYSGAIVFRP